MQHSSEHMMLRLVSDFLQSVERIPCRTFNDIDVPPTLVSFAVDVAKEKDIITRAQERGQSACSIYNR